MMKNENINNLLTNEKIKKLSNMINYLIKLYGESATIILENFNYEEEHKCLKVSDISHM
jgi:hypothetical protein